MLEWHAQPGPPDDGGNLMRSWVGGVIWEDLHEVFAHFDSEDSWKALLVTTNLFRRVARETAETLGFVYPEDLDRNISGFILSLAGKS